MNESAPLKIALVGCGLMGTHYADVFGAVNKVSLTACCDPTPDKLNDFAEKYGFSERYLDYGEMIGTCEIDGLLNVTPDHLHADVARTAIAAGIPLMTEKPLAASLGECRTLLDTHLKSPVPVLVNFSKRNAIAAAAAEEVLAHNLLGEIVRMDASYSQGWVFTRDWGDWEDVHAWAWRLSRESAPLGVLSDLGSHLVDLIRYVTGMETISVSGGVLRTVEKQGRPAEGQDSDSPDIAQGNLLTDNDTPVHLHCSRVDTGEKDRLKLVVYCRNGRLVLDLSEDRKAVKVMSTREVMLPSVFRDAKSGETAGLLASGVERLITMGRPESNYRRFVRMMAGEKVDAPGLIDGFRVQAVLQAIADSARDGGNTMNLSDYNS